MHIRLSSEIGGIPVVGGDFVVHLNEAGIIETITGFQLGASPSVTPNISTVTAQGKAILAADVEVLDSVSSELVFYYSQENSLNLSYRVNISGHNGSEFFDQTYFIDAGDGDVLSASSNLHFALDREINDLDGLGYDQYFKIPGSSTWHSYYFDGELERDEGDPVSNINDVDALYDFAQDAYDYFNQEYGMDSFDGSGGAISVRARIGDGTPGTHATEYTFSSPLNAFYSGTTNVFGFGTGGTSGVVTYNSFARGDIFYHEFTHGVTNNRVASSNSNGLEYAKESGALNEAYSDIFAAMIELENDNGQFDPSTWLIGEGLIVGGTNQGALRNLADPNEFGHSDNYDDRLYAGQTPTQDNDWGGVHSNSGIANHAFFLSAVGGQHVNQNRGTDVRALGAAAAADIYFDAYSRYNYTTNFEEAAYSLAASAGNLYGEDGVCSIIQAWYAVGVLDSMWRGSDNGWKITYLGWAYFDPSSNWVWLQHYLSWVYYQSYVEDNGSVHFYTGSKWVWTSSTHTPWYYDQSDSAWKLATEGSGY